jgi:hypothetical protein
MFLTNLSKRFCKKYFLLKNWSKYRYRAGTVCLQNYDNMGLRAFLLIKKVATEKGGILGWNWNSVSVTDSGLQVYTTA